MSRWAGYGKRDTQETRDGDLRFVGIDMVRDRSQLGFGVLARCENKRLRNGTANTRPGTGIPGDFNPAFGNNILGSAVYSNPNGDEMMLVAVNNTSYVWALQFGKDPVKINLTGGQDFTLTAAVEFAQAFDKVIVLRRPASNRPQMVWDGDVTHTFDAIALSTYGRKLVPPRWHGQPFKDRIVYYSAYRPDVPARDELIISEAGDYTDYDEVFGVYRINSGQSDFIVRVWPYFRNGIVIFKGRTLHFLTQFTLDPTAAVQEPVSVNLGAVGNKCFAETGGDVMFLSEPGGIYRVTEVIQEKIAAEAVAVSEPIQPIIDRINWVAATSLGVGGAVAQTLGIYTFFGLPLDHAVLNNAVLVYNNSTRQWESAPDLWLDPDFGFHAFHVMTYDNRRRLYAVDYTKAKVYLMYEGIDDETVNGLFEISDVIETRGYIAGEPDGFKRFHRAKIGLSTFNPEIRVTAISDGYNEEKLITETPLTKNRLKFYPHAHADFDPLTDDSTEPFREDYSTTDLLDYAIQDFESLPVATVWSIPGTSPPSAGVRQQSLERMALRQNGRWLSLRIENARGACDVLGASVDATPVLETVRMIA